MVFLNRKDLEDVFLLIVKMDRGLRNHLPIVRRHFRSAANLCKLFIERDIDIYYSGILIARKKKNSSKIVMDHEYKAQNQDKPFVFEVNA